MKNQMNNKTRQNILCSHCMTSNALFHIFFLKSDLRLLKDLGHKGSFRTDEDERFSHSVHVFRL